MFRFTRYGKKAVRRGGQFCCSSVANFVLYLCAKNYQNTMRFYKIIVNNKMVHFLPYSVGIIGYYLSNLTFFNLSRPATAGTTTTATA